MFAERQLLNVSDKQTNQRASTRKLLCPLLTRSLFRHKRSMAVAVCGRGRKGASKKIHVLRSGPVCSRGQRCLLCAHVSAVCSPLSLSDPQEASQRTSAQIRWHGDPETDGTMPSVQQCRRSQPRASLVGSSALRPAGRSIGCKDR